VTRDLFDRNLRRVRRDRAVRQGMDLFLLDRAFDDCLDRLRAVARRFDRALLIGAPSARWVEELRTIAQQVDIVDPSSLLAGPAIEEDRHDYGEAVYDLVVAVGTLDTVNDLPIALQLIRRAMKGDAALIGAMAGGDTLATLRACLVEADRPSGRIAARTHPRIDGPTLTQLLASAGFSMPVVDVDRVTLRYRSIADLIRDLRAMAATNLLSDQQGPMTRSRLTAAAAAFDERAEEGRTSETVDILHFVGWTPNQG